MITEVVRNRPERTAAYRLFVRMCKHKFHVLVRPWTYGDKWHAFAYLITDTRREEVRLHAFGVLIRQGAVRVKHVFPDGNLLYEAVN